MSKAGVFFAPVAYISQGFEELEAAFRRLMPCAEDDNEGLSLATAESHAELVLLHPFREGTGRLSRLVADIMATQAGRDPLRWSIDDEAGRNLYFATLRRGFVKEYKPLATLVREALPARSPKAPPR